MSRKRVNQSHAEDASQSNQETAIKECVRFIICREGSKIPIKRAEINNHLSTTCQISSNQVNGIIVEANKILKQVYGYKLVQVAPENKKKKSEGIQYVTILSEPCESLSSSVVEPKHRILLVAALTHIFMTGSPVKEDEMWKFLAEAGLLEENDHTGRKILTRNFTKQMYLQYNKVGEGDLSRYVFEWGQRAEEEVPKILLLNKMAQAFDKTPDHWCEQYREATEEASA